MSTQTAHNRSEWSAGRYVRAYTSDALVPVEVQLLVRYRERMAGRVLDIGCGAGRVLAYLVMIGADAHGVDLAPKMVEYCQANIPGAHVSLGDASRLRASVEGPFDVILGVNNLIDVFDDAERRRVLADLRSLLAPDGLLIFSSHDLGWHEARTRAQSPAGRDVVGTLRKLVERSPADVTRAVLRRRRIAANRKRLGPLEEHHDGYAILNDFPHDYSLLHYYITRDAQERQLQELGYEVVECLDGHGDRVEPGGHCPVEMVSDNIHYVARLA